MNTTENIIKETEAIAANRCCARRFDLIAKYACNFDLQNRAKTFLSTQRISETNAEFELVQGDWIVFRNGYDLEFMSEILGFDEDGCAYVLWDCYWAPVNLKNRLIKRIDKQFILSEKTRKKIKTITSKDKDIDKLFNDFIKKGIITVGYRQSTGKDSTFERFVIWNKIIRFLRKEGNYIKERNAIIDNSWATLSGGFWNETTFFL